MKVLLHGKNTKNIASLVKNLGFRVVTISPDVVISYGGDGTLLASERLFPGIPKLPIRDSLMCRKCSDHKEKVVLKALLDGQLNLKEYRKLHTNIYGKNLLALNDFVIRNKEQIHAIRFKVTSAMSSPDLIRGSINNQLLIGDGIVVATPFGSTGYFNSITGKTFSKGFAVALNNAIRNRSRVIKKDEGDRVDFWLVRGQAILTYDNSSDNVPLSEGAKLSFQLSGQVGRIYEPSSLRCPNCQNNQLQTLHSGISTRQPKRKMWFRS